MGSDVDKASNLSLDDAPGKVSFFSRFALPLRPRTRNLSDFHIVLNEPHRQYAAGDLVKGHVFMSVAKPFRMTHLTVALHGYVRAFKNAGAAAQLGPVNPAIVSSEGSRRYRYHGNGHVSLFQDEQILCGEGRLKPGRFKFEFNLEFPKEGLHSSIDFERGTISYVVTSTLTRPTTMAPTSTCETKVTLVEKVDIGSVVPPPQRTVKMQTMRRRPKRRKTIPSKSSTVLKQTITTDETSADPDTSRSNETLHPTNTNTDEPMPINAAAHSRNHLQNDVQSEFSGESAVSNNSSSNGGRGTEVNGDMSRTSASDEREITATVELQKGGCLPGDVLPVKIRVEHNRRMKSMNGVIVTLYRQGRVDYAPPAHMFENLSKEDAARLEQEDYYPKSKTGLGGLSLSAAGSCSVFRKDLSQAVAPLIIDPATLTANINTSIRVPEDVFPTIRGVPGGLISFKYHIEVVIDLGGKLGGPTAGTSQQPTRMGSGGATASPMSPYDGKNLWAGSLVDTDYLRREKGVIAVAFEVVVGTADTSRTRAVGATRSPAIVQQPSPYIMPIEPEAPPSLAWQEEHLPERYPEETPYHEAYNPWPHPQSPNGYHPSAPAHENSYYDFHHPEGLQTPAYVPPPEEPAQNNLSEKERAMRAEQRLLPSQPPTEPTESVAGPSQPYLPSNEAPPPGITISHADSPGGSAAQSPDQGVLPSAPTFTDLAQPGAPAPAEDKQERERRRLMQEASAPPEVPDDFDAASPPAPQPFGSAPSAPMLHDDDTDEHHQNDPYHAIAGPSAPPASEPLPRYER